MAKKNIDKRVRILTFLFYFIYPVHALYSMTMWKDILFAASMLIFTILLTELSVSNNIFKSKINLFFLILSMIFVILFRNNGIYIVILTFPFLFLFLRNEYKKIIFISCCILAFYGIWKGPVFSVFHIQEGAIGEALSIPLQQFARISKYHSDTLTNEEKANIQKYFLVDNIGEKYYPELSDDVKGQLNAKAFQEDKIGFLKLYFELFFEYPKTTLEAFLANNYGYWYPEATNWIVFKEISEPAEEDWQALNIRTSPIFFNPLVDNFIKIIGMKNIPILSMLFRIGFAFWLVLILITYTIYQKQYNYLLIYIPILALWLTCLSSPAFCEFRYMYSLFTCLPIYLGVHFICHENKKKDKD